MGAKSSPLVLTSVDVLESAELLFPDSTLVRRWEASCPSGSANVGVLDRAVSVSSESRLVARCRLSPTLSDSSLLDIV
jgi:hypothetical protein